MRKTTLLFADTTIVYYRLHSHSLLREAVETAAKGRPIFVSNFVRGEYIRGYVIGLVALYSCIKLEKSVEDGIHVFNAQMMNNPRFVKNALASAVKWLLGREDVNDVEKTLRRLGEAIRGTLALFDDVFFNRVHDPLRCEIGILDFRDETYDEDHILDFARDYDKVREKPQCDQCDFRASQQKRLQAAGMDLHSPQQQQQHAEAVGYVTQAKWMDKAKRTKKNAPSCWYCDRLGDTIIILSVPDDATLLTGDAQSFPTLATILGKQIQLIPSLDTLRGHRPEAPRCFLLAVAEEPELPHPAARRRQQPVADAPVAA